MAVYEKKTSTLRRFAAFGIEFVFKDNLHQL